ncbi:RNA polymerase sigma-70 factor (ECF subfamily) [Povalibacter uvarum]|uniref:RNA polymerase sigma-70 factor (ECF subfamily) n=1 Tax=Povalibacter uvarum TaxID=732238 RepID=A0A841HPE4_9GAMM|nr:sigma-70 family RNA polymerase sigma factor [Povalibacter uvarum]MBB6094110.1 RNA polymerase sigma-70 factor (ECF subfamily) [Povalibacter uvarum]
MTTLDASPTVPEMLSPGGDAERVQDERYTESIALHGDALGRLVRGYESRPDRRQDLLQDIHIALWRSFATFDQRCSLRTWVYRVAHIAATRHIVADRRLRLRELYTLDDVPEPEDPHNPAEDVDRSDSLQRLLSLIDRLKPPDRQVILLYLEDFSADAISEVIGLSPQNVATKIHRIKRLLATLFHAEERS